MKKVKKKSHQLISILEKDGGFVLKSGNEIKKNVYRYPAEEKMLEDLMTDGLVEEVDGKYKLKEDYPCSSISNATQLIYGGSKNGWEFWKDENGIILNDKAKGLRHNWMDKPKRKNDYSQ